MNEFDYANRHLLEPSFNWLRETDRLELNTLKRAVWEDLRVEAAGKGLLAVRNHSYLNPDEHAHSVGVEGDGIVSYCTCGQFTYRDTICKHMVRASMAIDDGEIDLAEVAPDAVAGASS